MKRPVSVLLVLALLAGLFPRTLPAQSSPKPPQKQIVQVVCGVIVLGAGIYVIWKLWKLCDKVLPPDRPPGSTNAPPELQRISTQSQVQTPLELDDSTVAYSDVSALGFVDPVYQIPFTTRLDAVLWASDNAKDWTRLYNITGWASDAGVLFLFSDPAGNPVLTDYCVLSVASGVPLDLGTGHERARFFKMTAQ